MNTRIATSELESFAMKVLMSGGAAELDAGPAAHCLVDASSRGVHTHGLFRLTQYVRELRGGAYNLHPDIQVKHTGGPSAVVDADGGMGYRPTLLATQVATELAAEHGLAMVAVRRSHHLGAAGFFARAAAQQGCIAFVTTTTSPTLAPPGGNSPVVGNNPMAFAFPRSAGHSPVVVDLALSQVARGNIRTAAAYGREIPPSWGFDRDGQPSTDPHRVLDGGFLAPMAEHKGYALAVAMEILAGVLTDSPFGLSANNHGNPDGGVGHVVTAVMPSLFSAQEIYEANLDRLADQIHDASANQQSVYLPGEIEAGRAADAGRYGLEIAPELLRELYALADDLGVPRPSPNVKSASARSTNSPGIKDEAC